MKAAKGRSMVAKGKGGAAAVASTPGGALVLITDYIQYDAKVAFSQLHFDYFDLEN